MERIYQCTRPKHVDVKEWKDCHICLVASCGYSRCFDPNPIWEKQGGICKFEHCIENMELTIETTEKSCPVFGHNCPGGEKQVIECNKDLEEKWKRVEQRMDKTRE
jgi:hypothetical protein